MQTVQAVRSQQQPVLEGWSQGWCWSSLLKPSIRLCKEQEEGLPKNRHQHECAVCSAAVGWGCFAVSLPGTPPLPQALGREEEPCFASPEKKGT